MRNLIFPAAMAASLALSSVAFAGVAPQPAQASKAPIASGHARREACEAAWRSQKTHSGTAKAFMKACIAKG